MAESKKFGNNHYHLSEPLPAGMASEIKIRSEQFLEFLNATKTTTHPIVRTLYNSVEQQLAGLTGMMEAERLRGGEDEMDVWERNGIKA